MNAYYKESYKEYNEHNYTPPNDKQRIKCVLYTFRMSTIVPAFPSEFSEARHRVIDTIRYIILLR
jgi:hypothetical protein